MNERIIRWSGSGVGICSLLAPIVLAGYDVQVNTVPDFLKDITVVAVVPATCPPRVNCISAESDLAQELQKYGKFTVIPAERVRQAMIEAEIKQIDDTTRFTLAEKLHADAFLLPVIAESGTESQGGVGVWTGYTVTIVDSQVAKGNVQLLLIASKSGKTLMQGTGFGESEWRSKKGVLRKVFHSILAKAFGSPTG